MHYNKMLVINLSGLFTVVFTKYLYDRKLFYLIYNSETNMLATFLLLESTHFKRSN